MHVAQAEPSSSFLEQAPTFASQLGVEPTFATSFDEQYGEPFEPTSPRLQGCASTSSLVLQPVLDTSAFSPPALAVDTLGTSAVAAADTMADSASLDTSIYLVDEQWQPSSAGTPGRSRSVTHAARLENPTGGLNLAAPPAAHTQSSYLPVRFAARQVGQSVTQRPAPPPQQQQQQQQQQRARAEHPPPRPAPQRQLEQSRHAPHYVEESQTGEQRFVPLQRAPKPARPIGRAVEPDFPLAEPLRRRAEQVHAVEEQLHVAREQPHPVVEPDQRRLEPVEEYDPTRPQLDDIRLSLPPPPPSVSRLHQRRNAIVATPPTPQPEEPPAFVIINGQRYELARASSPPPDPRFAPTIETRSSFEGATQAMASLSSARAARCPQAGVEPCRTDPSHAHGHPPPPGPELYASHDRFEGGSSFQHAPPPSSYYEQPGERVPSWTIPRQAVGPDHFFAQLVSRASPRSGVELERAHAGAHAGPSAGPSAPPSSHAQHSSAAQGYLPHPAYLHSHKAISPPPYVDGPAGYVGAPRSSCADKWRRAGPASGVGAAGGAPPPLSTTAYPTPESPSGLFNGGEYPGIGPTSFVPLEGVVAAEIRSEPPATVEPLRPARVEGAAEGAVQGAGVQECEPRAAAAMVGLGLGLG